jgi:hypothetical protein
MAEYVRASKGLALEDALDLGAGCVNFQHHDVFYTNCNTGDLPFPPVTLQLL